jgi:FecR protein/Putative zinc-finger
MDDRRLQELIELYLDGELSDADAAELRLHLESNPSAVTTVLKETQLHVLCRTALRIDNPQILSQRAHQLLANLPLARRQQAANTVMRRINWRRNVHFWTRWGVVAAAVMLIVFAQPWEWSNLIHAHREALTVSKAPRIIFISGAAQDGNGNSFVIGQLVKEGDSIYTSNTGSLTMSWSDGTKANIEKNSVCQQLSSDNQRLRLERGVMTVRAAHRPSAGALVILTPDATIRVVGTRFSIGVEPGNSVLQVTEGLVKFERSVDGKSSLVGAGEIVRTGYVPPPPICMSTEQIQAVRSAIAAGRQPWAQTWKAIESLAPIWVQEPIKTPEVMTIYSWVKERPQHTVSRHTYGSAAQIALGLALASRLSDNQVYAQRAAEYIRAWIRVPLNGLDADFVAMDTSTVFVQAADLIRRTGIWSDVDDVAMEAFISKQIESRIPNMENSSMQRARWRALTARMLIAGWRGDKDSIRKDMQLLVKDCEERLTPQALQALRNEGEGTILHTINQAMMAADVARAAGVLVDPPANYQMALIMMVNEIDQGANAAGRHLEIDPVIYGVPGWRLPITTPLQAGPRPVNQVAFSWYYPTVIGLDPRLVP